MPIEAAPPVGCARNGTKNPYVSLKDKTNFEKGLLHRNLRPSGARSRRSACVSSVAVAMALSLRTPTVVCKEVIGTTFSFYSPEQVCARPVAALRRACGPS